MPELTAILDSINPNLILLRLSLDRTHNRPGYPLEAFWRAYVASFILNLPHTNALIRRLEEDKNLRAVCGFKNHLPHRTTFNHFIQRLSHHPILIEHALIEVTNQLKELLPNLGKIVAVDSTTVRTHGNPNRKVKSDPEASWTAKNSPKGKDGEKEWHYGYKLHAVTDATYGVPLGQIITTAKRNDSPFLPKLVNKTETWHSWFSPDAVIADRGYDSEANNRFLYNKSIAAIIHIRETRKSKGEDEVHTLNGQPLCMGKQPMKYIETNVHQGHLYRCPDNGCHLKDSFTGAVRHCDARTWEHPRQNLRFFSWIPRHTKTWKDLYTQRQAIERMFKSMKQSRRLENHCIRGLRHVTLHSLISLLTYQATALAKVKAGKLESMRWMVKKVY